ncbi:MAG: phenylalanine--tRNA ligase subunit beta [Candidatus Omnitrophica bacterium]|nr:phenylalanine--tRNA ligase subunit beta [Candidatus Omnitrophota bacterium]
MKFTYNWLKEFVNINMSAQELADKLTMAGLEVGSLKAQGNDFVFEAEITSNRPDWLSVAGIAREVAAITRQKFKSIPQHPVKTQGASSQFSIEIENKKDCPLYIAKIIRDVNITPSPAWLKDRLELIGCRSINNIVDITNYVMFTWGQPLHAFDLDKFDSDRVTVRRGRPGEKLTLIDGQQKALDADILVIADRANPAAIAGIMGGEDTEVTGASKNILLESAVFDPALVRRGRRKLGLESESSYRFERGVDAQGAEFASCQCARLIQELAKGRPVLARSSASPKIKVKNIALDLTHAQKISGIDNISRPKIKSILGALGFKAKARAKNTLSVEIPSWRRDVYLEADLIEEIVRILGYAKIPTTLPAIMPQIEVNKPREMVLETKNILAGLGLNEVITYSLVSRDLLKIQANQDAEPIEIANPLSKEQEILRPSLIASLLKCVAYNLNQKESYINIFEIAKGFMLSGDSRPREELLLGVALCGAKTYFLQQGVVRDDTGFLNLKGILQVLFERLGIKDYDFCGQSAAEIAICLNKEKAGVMLYPGKNVLDSLGIKNKEAVVLEISLDKVFSCADLTRKFVPMPVYPAISRDISFILKEELSAEELIKSIRDKAGPLLSGVKITDYYKGKQIAPGFKGLTISCMYRSAERTLTESQVNPVHTGVVNLLKEKFGVQIR